MSSPIAQSNTLVSLLIFLRSANKRWIFAMNFLSEGSEVILSAIDKNIFSSTFVGHFVIKSFGVENLKSFQAPWNSGSTAVFSSCFASFNRACKCVLNSVSIALASCSLIDPSLINFWT